MFEIGTTLREARLRRSLDLPACEAGTKIRSRYLRAMEDEQFDVLPAPTYVRGFLRTYAEFLGLDWQLVLDEYESRFGAFTTALESESPVRTRRSARSGHASRPRSPEARLLWLAMGGVLSVALLVWLGVGDVREQPTVAVSPDPPAGQVAEGARYTIVLTGTGSGTGLVVRVGDASGRSVFDRRLPAFQEKTFRVKGPLWMEVEDPAGLELSVGGLSREVPAPGAYIISPEGLKPAS